MEKIPYEAVGFAFPDEKMMEKALKEAEGIRYVKNSADLTDPQVVFNVYRQMVNQRLFETPVGYSFLYELQENLWTNPAISNDTIPPIPVAAVSKDAPAAQRARAEQPQSVPRIRTEVKTKIVHKTEVKNVDYKIKFKACMSVCAVLLLIVIGMFAVTATSGNINIVNYENALIEKYEHWETQLNEREEKLREREADASQNSEQ
ncbi:MAG: hypothetical protein HFJ05_08170 [Eubacterium sp.]|nr:hypothetical protein [Eubacterium sp.]